MTIYGDLQSGNCLKVKYIADVLSLPYVWRDVDINKGESRTPEFLALNPAGQVPAVVFGDRRALTQSNAILRYLARDSRFIPSDPYLAAKADEWMFWEQYSHEPYVATARFHIVYKGGTVESRDPGIVARAERALDRLELGLGETRFLVGDAMTVADIALLAYTRLAPQGGFDLSGRPAIIRWIAACEHELSLGALSSASV
ncbi:MAG: glutathione S-transferase family protein [Devosia sp.]|nr:glutathione S-transferase family protein [Devosia sp.]